MEQITDGSLVIYTVYAWDIDSIMYNIETCRSKTTYTLCISSAAGLWMFELYIIHHHTVRFSTAILLLLDYNLNRYIKYGLFFIKATTFLIPKNNAIF